MAVRLVCNLFVGALLCLIAKKFIIKKKKAPNHMHFVLFRNLYFSLKFFSFHFNFQMQASYFIFLFGLLFICKYVTKTKKQKND